MIARNTQLDILAERAGIVFDSALDFMPTTPSGAIDVHAARLAMDSLAMDAPYDQQPLVTTANGGIPAFLTTFVNPRVIQALLAPTKAENIYGVKKLGDWTTQTAMFPMLERTGYAATYNDHNQAGRSDINVQFPQRQSIRFQTFTEWGELQAARAGLANIDWASRLELSSANTLEREMNLIQFYGFSGMQNYGGLNDPSLPASLTPGTKAATGTSWSVATPTEIIADIQKMYAQVVGATGTNGNVELTSKFTLAIHPISETYLVTPNSFGLTAMTLLKSTFPNVTVKTAVQYLSGTTYSAQFIVEELDGQQTAEAAFTDKMRAHTMVADVSSWKRKVSAGSWGTVIYYPIGIAAMAGI